MSDVKPVLIVSHDLCYKIEFCDGYVSETMRWSERLVCSSLESDCPIQTHEVVNAAFKSVLSHYGVLSIYANRADLGPLPGRYVNHPWAQRFVDVLAVEIEVAELLARIPNSVRLQCYHNGEGDQETIATLPFDGWEQLDQLLRAVPYSNIVKDIVGADVMRIMLNRQGGNFALCKGELHWQIDSGDLPLESEAARWRKEAEALRNGLAVKQGGERMK